METCWKEEENEPQRITNDGLHGNIMLWDQQHKAGLTKRDSNGVKQAIRNNP
jgi:hypothetical protein